MDIFTVPHKVLCDFLLDKSDATEEDLLQHLIDVYNIEPELHSVIDRKLRENGYIKNFKTKLKNVLHQKRVFNKKYEKWLQCNFEVNLAECEKKRGRPSGSDFLNSSTSTKRRKLIEIENKYSELEIEEAFLYTLRTSGRKKLANTISQLLQSDVINNDESDASIVPYTADEAIALIEDAKLTKYQYEHIRMEAAQKNANIYPLYKNLSVAKKECYPQSIEITEKGASVDLQSLIKHTVERLIKDPTVLLPPITDRKCELELTLKWGCDGSSDQSQYKQKFEDSKATDNTIFTISMVPLCLRDTCRNEDIWKNPQPAATKYCRPIKFEFAKETKEKTLLEVQEMKEKIKNLVPVEIETEDGIYNVKAIMKLTMVDGKVCQALTKTPSAATCYICGVQPSQMNKLNIIQNKPKNIENYEFGLSTLHAWIRFMECILHISYRLDFRKTAAITEIQKEQVNGAKKRVSDEFKKRMGLIVDKPKHGHGSSNDGNTARRFFADPEATSDITGVDKRLIVRFSVILQALACGRPVDPSKFETFAFETAQLYVSLYSWYYMPVTVHKILLHGSDVICYFHLAIGQFSEEAAEARNKDFKRFRLYNTRKCSRLLTNEDIIHKLLISSDPFITSLRTRWTKKIKTIDPEAENLLKEE